MTPEQEQELNTRRHRALVRLSKSLVHIISAIFTLESVPKGKTWQYDSITWSIRVEKKQ